MAELIYYMRHGESQDLVDKIRSRPEAPLTNNGRLEIEATAEEIVERGLVFDTLISSPLPRARESIKIVADRIGYPREDIQIWPELRERDWGVATGMPNALLSERWPDGFDTVPGAETENDLEARAAVIYPRLLALPGRLLVGGHGTLGRKLIRVAHGLRGTENAGDESGKIATAGLVLLHPLPARR